jgi:NAD(P)-dependent dehydrogenase (short-subunit alcohol dehydrogenase family)
MGDTVRKLDYGHNMNADATIAVVTGANRGIGLEISRQLAKRGARVIMTARNFQAGQAALENVKAHNPSATFHPLDVTDQKSITALAEFLKKQFGRVDALINNAGILLDQDGDVMNVDIEVLRSTLETNTLAPLRLSQTLAALLQQSKEARIINISSGMRELSGMGPDHAAYRLSKGGLNALTIMMSSALSAKIAVNAVCPGWVRTDMGGPGASRDVSQGADTPVWLALEAPHSLTGKLLRDRKTVDW